MDFQKQKQGLLMKNLHNFFNKENVPWVNMVWNYYPNGVPQDSNLCGSFSWRDVMKLAQIYMGFCKVKVGVGDNAVFWSDTWNGTVLQSYFPRLFSFPLNAKLSVKEVLWTED